MTTAKVQAFQTTGANFLALVVVGMMMFSGCNGDEVTGPQDHQVEAIIISPDSASLPVGEQQEFTAIFLDANGEPVQVDPSEFNIQWEWWSSDPDVFTVEAGGLATAQSPGEEFCIVEATILVGSSNFTGRDSAFVHVF